MLKICKKLQEKRFVFVKILAIIIPENGAKVSKIKCFQFAQQTLFKNMVFFGNFFLIYISAMCANEIVEFVSGLNISMYIFIIILNIIGATILAVISFRKISKLDNESVVRSVGQWI